MNKDQLREIRNSCDKFLHGHYPVRPIDYFCELSKEVGLDQERDHYGVGEELQKFEDYLSDLFGFEDCLFFQSGTMAQIISMRIWSERAHNHTIGFHPNCHLELHEHMSYQKLHQLDSVLIGHKERLITLDDLKALKKSPSVVLFELPQREIGGQLPEFEDLVEQVSYLKDQGIKVHLDGARIWECKAYYKKEYKEICSLFDSVYISFYKGIGGVAGAALLGSCSFIDEAKIWNRRHGGNLITAFPLYLSAKLNLEKRLNLFQKYYEKTLELTSELQALPSVRLKPEKPFVNMFHLYIKGEESILRERILKQCQKDKIWGLSHIAKSEIEGFCKAEWYVGDATLDIATNDIKDFIKNIID